MKHGATQVLLNAAKHSFQRSLNYSQERTTKETHRERPLRTWPSLLLEFFHIDLQVVNIATIVTEAKTNDRIQWESHTSQSESELTDDSDCALSSGSTRSITASGQII